MDTHSLISRSSSIYSADLEHTGYERPNSPTPYRSRGFANWRTQLRNSEDDSVVSSEDEAQFMWLPPASAYTSYSNSPFADDDEIDFKSYVPTQTPSTPRQNSFSNSSQNEAGESESHEIDPIEEIISLYSQSTKTSTSLNASPILHSDALVFAFSDSDISTQTQDALGEGYPTNSSEIEQEDFEPHELDPVEEIISLYSDRDSLDIDTSRATSPSSHPSISVSPSSNSSFSSQSNPEDKLIAIMSNSTESASQPPNSPSEDITKRDSGYASDSPIADRLDLARSNNKRFSFDPRLSESSAFDTEKRHTVIYIEAPRAETSLSVNFDAECKARRSHTSAGFRRSLVGSVKGMRKSMSAGTVKGRWSWGTSLSVGTSLNMEGSPERRERGVLRGIKRWGTKLRGRMGDKGKGGEKEA